MKDLIAQVSFDSEKGVPTVAFACRSVSLPVFFGDFVFHSVQRHEAMPGLLIDCSKTRELFYHACENWCYIDFYLFL